MHIVEFLAILLTGLDKLLIIDVPLYNVPLLLEGLIFGTAFSGTMLVVYLIYLNKDLRDVALATPPAFAVGYGISILFQLPSELQLDAQLTIGCLFFVLFLWSLTKKAQLPRSLRILYIGYTCGAVLFGVFVFALTPLLLLAVPQKSPLRRLLV